MEWRRFARKHSENYIDKRERLHGGVPRVEAFHDPEGRYDFVCGINFRARCTWW